MTEFERINAPRVDRLLKALDTIQTSAASNRASPAEVSELLRPIAQRMQDVIFDDTPVDDGDNDRSTITQSAPHPDQITRTLTGRPNAEELQAVLDLCDATIEIKNRLQKLITETG